MNENSEQEEFIETNENQIEKEKFTRKRIRIDCIDDDDNDNDKDNKNIDDDDEEISYLPESIAFHDLKCDIINFIMDQINQQNGAQLKNITLENNKYYNVKLIKKLGAIDDVLQSLSDNIRKTIFKKMQKKQQILNEEIRAIMQEAFDTLYFPRIECPSEKFEFRFGPYSVHSEEVSIMQKLISSEPVVKKSKQLQKINKKWNFIDMFYIQFEAEGNFW